MGRGRLEDWLAEERARLEARALRRERFELPLAGADFTSNDTLGLSRHPRVIAAARAALEEHGAGGRASRLLGGGSPLDARAEAACTHWLGAEAALLFPSGYHANLGLVSALAGPGDLLVCDERNHASLVDGARLSRARIAVYRHGDVAGAERLLRAGAGARRAFVITESLFSMDGDVAPLAELAEACARHEAALLVDEAHACGLLGQRGAGLWASLAAQHTLPEAHVARVVTGGKALGVAGAFVVGSLDLIAHLVDRARSHAFTTALPPATTGALLGALEVVQQADAERARVLALAQRLAKACDLPEPAGAIVPLVLGDARGALEAAAGLRAAGLHVRAVRPPTVPEGRAGLRLVVHAHNTDAELELLIRHLTPLLARRAQAGGIHPAAPAETGAIAPPDGAAASPARATAPAALAPVLVVAGTDTGIGKTVLSALLMRAAIRLGLEPRYWKLVQTGAEDDTSTVRSLAKLRAHEHVEPAWRFDLPASPHAAATAVGVALDLVQLGELLAAHRASCGAGPLLIELAGGLLVPLTDTVTQLDWLARHRLPLVLVARSGLGTLNHTLLSLEALRHRHLEPRALFLVGPPHSSNRATLERLSAVEQVLEVPLLDPLEVTSLDDWISTHDLGALFGAPSP